MNSQHMFLALIGTQSLHSLEEYIFRLWETFPPSGLITSLVLLPLALLLAAGLSAERAGGDPSAA